MNTKLNKKILLFGFPGAGKGTLSAYIGKNHDIPCPGMGFILRDCAKGDLELRALMQTGDLIPDSTTNKLIESVVNNLDSFILDGYPRTVEQTKHILGICDIDFVLYLIADESVVVDRMLGRNRNDDTADIIKKRLGIHKENLNPIMNCLKDNNIPVYEIDANGTMDDTSNQFDKIIS